MMNHITLFLSRLQGVRKLGHNRWVALCPAHDDHTPSLGIGVGDRGQVVFKCRSQQCSQLSVLDALDLDFSDLFVPDLNFARTGRGIQTGRPPVPGWARPWAMLELKRAIHDLFLLCTFAYSIGSPERDLALDALRRANDALHQRKEGRRP